MKTAITTKQIGAAVEIVRAVADAIRELKEVPSGVLYAHLMGFLSLEQYNSVVGTLKRAGLVVESSHVLRWVEPEPVRNGWVGRDGRP